MKNCLKIWPKLVEADEDHHKRNGRIVESSLAEWIHSHSKDFIGREISVNGAPLMARDELVCFLERQLQLGGAQRKKDEKVWAVFMLNTIRKHTKDEEK